ncbi:MAG: hypothetical protein JW838_03665 [Spirochaetes bacterium]|nr:hypothetical protein [Spirochaetota bacterium]
MKRMERLLSRYEKTCRKMHRCMMGRDFRRGIPLLERLFSLAREIAALGDDGRESLFRMAEGDDLPVALASAHVLLDVDRRRSAGALRAIVRKDDGFFAYAARMMLKCSRGCDGAARRDTGRRFFASA